MERPPGMLSVYSSPSLKVTEEVDIIDDVLMVHWSSALEISIVGLVDVISLRGTHGIPNPDTYINIMLYYTVDFEWVFLSLVSSVR